MLQLKKKTTSSPRMIIIYFEVNKQLQKNVYTKVLASLTKFAKALISNQAMGSSNHSLSFNFISCLSLLECVLIISKIVRKDIMFPRIYEG